jgi:hypothetical protein
MQSYTLLEPIPLIYYKDNKEHFGLPFKNGFNYFEDKDKFEIKYDKNPETPTPEQEQNPLKGIPPSFIYQLSQSNSLSNKRPQHPNNVARFNAPGTSSSPQPAQMRRTSSSPPQRTSSSQSKHGASSSQPLAKKQKTDHNPPIDLEHKRLLEQQKDRIRQDSLKSTIRREYAESICYPPKRYVPTNPTADEKVEQENQEFIAEQKRIKRLEERYPGVSIETLLRFLQNLQKILNMMHLNKE